MDVRKRATISRSSQNDPKINSKQYLPVSVALPYPHEARLLWNKGFSTVHKILSTIKNKFAFTV